MPCARTWSSRRSAIFRWWRRCSRESGAHPRRIRPISCASASGSFRARREPARSGRDTEGFPGAPGCRIPSTSPMPQKPIELILMRQLAATLATPIFLVDPAGTLVFYNPAAERTLGLRFDETGEMPLDEWSRRWCPTGDDGEALSPARLPLSIALAERRPAHGSFWIAALDGARRRVEVAAVPLIAVPDVIVGAAAIFWESAR